MGLFSVNINNITIYREYYPIYPGVERQTMIINNKFVVI